MAAFHHLHMEREHGTARHSPTRLGVARPSRCAALGPALETSDRCEKSAMGG